MDLNLSNDPEYWRKRAKEAWSFVEQRYARTKASMVDIAPPRRFPPPWSLEDTGACLVMKDSTGQKLGHFYYEEELQSSAELLTRDEARRIAANVAKLPELLQQHNASCSDAGDNDARPVALRPRSIYP